MVTFKVHSRNFRDEKVSDRYSDALFPFVNTDITLWMQKHYREDSGYGLNELWRSQDEPWDEGEFRVQIHNKHPIPDERVLDIAIARTVNQFYYDGDLPWYADFQGPPAQFSSQYNDWKWQIGRRLTIGEFYFILYIIYSVVWNRTAGWDYKTVALYPSLVKETLLTKATAPVVLTKLSNEWLFNTSGVYSNTFKPSRSNYQRQPSMHWLNFFYYDYGRAPSQKADPGDTSGWTWSVGISITGGVARPLFGPSYNGLLFDLGSLETPDNPKIQHTIQIPTESNNNAVGYYNLRLFYIKGEFVSNEFNPEATSVLNANILTLAPGDRYDGDEVINWLKSQNVDQEFFASHSSFITHYEGLERRGSLYLFHFKVTGK